MKLVLFIINSTALVVVAFPTVHVGYGDRNYGVVKKPSVKIGFDGLSSNSGLDAKIGLDGENGLDDLSIEGLSGNDGSGAQLGVDGYGNKWEYDRNGLGKLSGYGGKWVYDKIGFNELHNNDGKWGFDKIGFGMLNGFGRSGREELTDYSDDGLSDYSDGGLSDYAGLRTNTGHDCNSGIWAYDTNGLDKFSGYDGKWTKKGVDGYGGKWLYDKNGLDEISGYGSLQDLSNYDGKWATIGVEGLNNYDDRETKTGLYDGIKWVYDKDVFNELNGYDGVWPTAGVDGVIGQRGNGDINWLSGYDGQRIKTSNNGPIGYYGNWDYGDINDLSAYGSNNGLSLGGYRRGIYGVHGNGGVGVYRDPSGYKSYIRLW